MNPAWSLAFAALVPLLCLGMLLWLSWLEETLADDVAAAQKRRTPKPVLAIATPADTSPAPRSEQPALAPAATSSTPVETPAPAPALAPVA